MTAKEMYIKVINDLQAIGSQRTRKYYPEQIELELNTTIEQYVTTAVKELPNGFYTVDSGYADAVQPLIVRKKLPVYTSGPDFLSELPNQLYRTLELGANTEPCKALTDLLYTTKSFIYLKFKPGLSTATDKVFYKNLSFKVGGVAIYSRVAGGYSINDINFLIDELVANVPDLSWEDTAKISLGGHLIYKTVSTLPVTVEFDGVSYPFVNVQTIAVNEVNFAAGKLLPVRRILNQSSIGILTTAYYKPSHVELPALINAHNIQVFTPLNFIVNQLLITYIRKPRKISISLGIGSDLAPMIHSTICDKTVQRVRERIGDPKIQTGVVLEN